MWHVIYEAFLPFLAVLFTVVSVKFTDDYLDEEQDRLLGKYNFTLCLGKGIPIYGLLSLAVAATLDATVSIPLFLACYILGMCHDTSSHYPLGLTGLQEGLFVLLFGYLWFGWEIFSFSLLFIFAVQCLDDWIDAEKDRHVGKKNFAHSIGKIECILLALICFSLACCMNAHLFFPTLTGFLLTYVVLMKVERGHLK